MSMYYGAGPESAAGARPSGKKGKAPQDTIASFWSKYLEKAPSKITAVFPPTLYADLLPQGSARTGTSVSRSAAESYNAAVAQCKARVARIVRECHRTNEKFVDAEFDLEGDFGRFNCLRGLTNSSDAANVEDQAPDTGYDVSDLRAGLSLILGSGVLGFDTQNAPLNLAALSSVLNREPASPPRYPSAVHRVDWIYEKPEFLIDGFSDLDVQQGANGDCWWLAAVATLCSVEGVMDRVCVARDEECGVYGFVFFRDGEWIWTVIDDNLYLNTSDYQWDDYDARGEKERKWKERYQTGSTALYFARSSDLNETWLPLLEKAFAKVHGDYGSIEGGLMGEGVEDMTGGVTSCLYTNRILNKNRLWTELKNENKEFLWALGSPGASDTTAKNGIALSHAYSISEAVEVKGEDGKTVKLVKVRNPWGKRNQAGNGEWDGPWSDGSKEWTPYWMKKLDHTFGDDGIFWISYEDLLKRFRIIDRTRLFGPDWHVVQKWTSVNVAWVAGYMKHKFKVTIKKAGPVVVVLTQLDSRYFKGLEGPYSFELHFILRSIKDNEEIVRARDNPGGDRRSISAEVDLEPGEYEVIPKILAQRWDDVPRVENVVKKYAEANPQKLRQIGINHDIANAKGLTAEEVQAAKDANEEEVKEVEKDNEKAEKAAKTEEVEAKDAKDDAKPEEKEKATEETDSDTEKESSDDDEDDDEVRIFSLNPRS
ncbi:cysteine proteinase [Microthyrium microscopicum]|uniref:Cysteine proteinase n=1 Tax=Microthyrium microscopicum TaxID=703497 RepID=A0A6A6UAS3_9PEZI|nr:cysteine proteinase [Microthyrium microscopicum]